jgi:diguanylate cyclase (GGDEF)-like protein/PAS domain S-box-containing protein
VVALGEVLRFIIYRLGTTSYRVLRRLVHGDRRLWRSEGRFAALLEAAPDAMVIVDRHGDIRLVNAQAERMFGYARADLIGQPVGRLIPERLRAVHREHVKSYRQEAVPRPMGIGLELRGRRADGTEFPIEISLSPLGSEEGLLVSAAIRDVTERKRAIDELAAAEALFRSAFDGSPIGKALTSADGRIERANVAFCDLVGYSAEDLQGLSFSALVHPDHLAGDETALQSLVRGERLQHKAETRWVHASGHALWVAVQANPIEIAEDPAGRRPRVFIQVQDITYRKRYEDNLQYLATHDPLTGLHNRASFQRRLEDHAELVHRYGAEGAVVLLDLDHFKYVNDTLGHLAGDVLIARVAGVLDQRLRDSDVLARIGGDEFAALLPHANAESATRVAGDLLQALREERIVVPATRDRTITASVGVALFDGAEGTTGEDTLVSADLAMYDAKEAGRNQVALFRTDDHAQARMKGRITWAERIAVAIQEERFTLVAQPMVELATGRATQFEVLLRMRDEHGDLIPPGAFLYIAERLGMIDQIDAMTVSKALRTVAAHENGRSSRVEINLSGVSIGQPEIIELIESELRETGMDPNHVIFEITETAAISNLTRAREFSQRLGMLGCRFALDDFGAGFGSFYYLKHIAFDYLKIDGEFVRDCVASETDRLMIQSVVGIARGLGRATVAEHVGDDATVGLLRDLGVDYGQGFHLGHPIALETLLDRLPAADPRLS